MIKKEFAERIKKLCQQKGISISDLEQKAGYSIGMISRWQSSSDDFAVLSKIIIMAEILGVTVDELLGIANAQIERSERGSCSFVALLEGTRSGELKWNNVNNTTTFPINKNDIPLSDGGKSIYEMWYVQVNSIYVLLVAYCDNIDDLNEQIELSVYGILGHSMPIGRISVKEIQLKELYVQIQIQEAFM